MIHEIEKGVQIYQTDETPKNVLHDIEILRKRLGKRIVIAAHHYERDDIVRFADFTGDSLKLAQDAAAVSDCEYIVFCGVHFMAESADIVSGSGQTVISPDPSAGCSLADMADAPSAEIFLKQLSRADTKNTVPVTYINSSAAIKAFVGKNGGTVCTSGNARRIFDWAARAGDRILFLPDQHLGRNTALDAGIPPEKIVMARLNDDSPEYIAQFRNARVILWDGYCSVHRQFTVDHVASVRRKHPGVRVIVHPECSRDVTEAADGYGSTGQIISAVEKSPAGTKWAVGTEAHLVNRLAAQFPDKSFVPLADPGFQCSTMTQITPEKLLAVLRAAEKGNTAKYRVAVAPEIARDAAKALHLMLSLS